MGVRRLRVGRRAPGAHSHGVLGAGATQADYDWLGTIYTLEEDHAVKAIVEGSDAYEEQLDDPDLSTADRALMEKWGEKSALTMPLVYQDEIVGCLTLVEKRAPPLHG